MPTILHDLMVARPRDLFRARQRARQIAGTLRFSPHEQLLFAVTVFDLACQGWKRRGRVGLQFVLDGQRLQVWLNDPAAEAGEDETAIRLDRATADAAPVWDVEALQRLLKRLRDRPAPPADRPLLDMPLRCQDLGMGREDLPWVIEQLAEITPLRLLDEIEQHNADLLRLLRQVQVAREAVRPAPVRQPTAA
jgi:HPt (histidine-containing phosphotransfer) domain-containing protein